MLSPVEVSVEEHLKKVPRWFMEVIRHAVQHGAALVLVAATFRSGKDLRDMATRFPPVEKPKDVDALAMEFKSAMGAIAEYEGVEDVIRSAPYDV